MRKTTLQLTQPKSRKLEGNTKKILCVGNG